MDFVRWEGKDELNARPSVAPEPWDGVKPTKDWANSCFYTILPRPRNHGYLLLYLLGVG